MTSNTTPEPFVVSTSHLRTVDGFERVYPYNAFDKSKGSSNIYDCWGSNPNTFSNSEPITKPCWIMIKLDTPKKVSYYGMNVRGVETGTYQTAPMPNTWNLEGSNDGINFIILDTKEGITWQPISYDAKNWYVSNNNNYLYYRLNVIKNNGSNTITVGELRLYSK
jgi:hypothetical protein